MSASRAKYSSYCGVGTSSKRPSRRLIGTAPGRGVPVAEPGLGGWAVGEQVANDVGQHPLALPAHDYVDAREGSVERGAHRALAVRPAKDDPHAVAKPRSEPLRKHKRGDVWLNAIVNPTTAGRGGDLAPAACSRNDGTSARKGNA